MLISKFDLYKSEWLELVFEGRNKAYGAYELRQHYANTMVKAMAITLFVLLCLCGAVVLLSGHDIAHHDTGSIITIAQIQPPPVAAIKKIEPPAPAHLKQAKPAPAVATIKNVPMEVKVDAEAQKPVINADLTKAIGQVTSPGKGKDDNVLPDDKSVTGTGTPPSPDVSIHPVFGLDVMPEPVGGEGAWAKFLNKNLRFPPAAQDEGISGRVFLSFIIEKDGSLSNIIIERGAGHGFDEEALRVLKLAKAWKPGQQNGQPVRVKYVIPINFQVSE